MIHKIKTAFLTLLLLAWAMPGAMGQTATTEDHPWFISAGAGTSFGQCTFRSITEYGAHWGAQGSIFGGYRFSRLFSVEAGLQFGGQIQSALDCCTYWLAEDGTRYMNPVAGETGWYYHDVSNRTGWGKLAFQANADLLSLFTAPDCRWSIDIGPQISAVTTKTKLITPDKTIDYDRQWHLGLGGQASVGYQITERLGASLFGGITCLTGQRFDNIPEHAHKSNLFYDAGIKVTFSFGGHGRAKEEAMSTNEAEAARLAAEQSALEEAARLEREKAEREKAEREKAEQERIARERAERERIEREQAEKEAAFHTPIPTVYFANNSKEIVATHGASLETALAILQKYPDFNLEIHAYCSKAGTEEYNMDLSKKRMEEVQNWFISRGIAPERMGKAYFHGIDHNAPSAAKARRAELWFVK